MSGFATLWFQGGKKSHENQTQAQSWGPAFPYSPSHCIQESDTMFYVHVNLSLFHMQTHRVNVWGRRVENQNKKQSNRLAKGDNLKWCLGVHVYVGTIDGHGRLSCADLDGHRWAWQALLSSPLQILLHVVPQPKLSLENQGSSRHQDPGLCKYTLYMNTTSAVSKHYFRAYKTCFFSLTWFLYRI